MKLLCAGTFDYFHLGHQWTLWQAVSRAEALSGGLLVVVARDATVRRLKGFWPAGDEQERWQRVQTEMERVPWVRVRLGRADGDFVRLLEEEAVTAIWAGYDQRIPEMVAQKWLVERSEAYHPRYFKSSYFRSGRGVV